MAKLPKEIQEKRKAFQNLYKNWGKENPDWINDKSIQFVLSMLNSDRNREVYRQYLLKWSAWIDKTPDRAIEERKKQLEDEKIEVMKSMHTVREAELKATSEVQKELAGIRAVLKYKPPKKPS